MVGEAEGRGEVTGGRRRKRDEPRVPVIPSEARDRLPSIFHPMKLTPLLILLAVIGCGGPGKVDPLSIVQPGVRLHHLAVRNLGLSGGILDLVLAMHNPNRIALNGTSLVAGLDIEGSHFGDVNLSDPFSLTASDTTLLTVPLSFRWSGLATAARAVLDYGAVNYALNGHPMGTAPELNLQIQVPFSGQGNVPLLRP